MKKIGQSEEWRDGQGNEGWNNKLDSNWQKKWEKKRSDGCGEDEWRETMYEGWMKGLSYFDIWFTSKHTCTLFMLMIINYLFYKI